ncbi:hypothetical protein [Nocardioides sp. Kera G14]|uniref:hypothetical protein n=1 Tax=Nocardioides sp. Kera G14 TaxID=2884264 RepID=UPI001D0FDF58|nr:hypothetical protein [Nocardioides sp. Kera G14]UDY22230.1 hypothetical protein LH076_09045 [Nocardioides sp. Kera G14]
MSNYATLTREQLAALVPELLLVGQMIDRSGMAWCISEFGREEMLQIAIEEWAAASPIYTRRMQAALAYEPAEPGKGDIVTIFKGLQLDIGAPPQFLDFRFTVDDPWHGGFSLPFCGALADVEGMGDAYVKGMCHTIEDPTFDATAVATNPKAQVRPVHRPPRVPAGRVPVCSWTVIIDESYPDAVGIPALAVNERSRAATLELEPIDATDEGVSDYRGPLLADLDFAAFSHSALVRIADEVCLQMALLDRAFVLALKARADTEQLLRLRRKQLTGFAGIAAMRVARALDLPATPEGALELLRLHPMLNPAAYVRTRGEAGTLAVSPGPAHEDAAWVSLIGPDWAVPLAAAVRELDPHFDVTVTGADDEWVARVVVRDEETKETDEVAVTKISLGAGFAFEKRRSLPLLVNG